VTKVPIACTLTAVAAVDRLAEWQTFLSSMVVHIDHHRTTATLTLRDGNEAIVTAVDLAEREKACCAFFEFSLELVGSAAHLLVDVPDDAAPVLSDLLSLVPS
jgi:hypothetical protein